MKYMKQLLIILLISAAGEGLHKVVPLPIPASIYGLVILFLALTFHIVKIDQVKETAEFFIEIMPVMFIPAGVGLITAWDELKSVWLQVLVIVAVTTVIVMAVTGRITQAVARRSKKRDAKK